MTQQQEQQNPDTSDTMARVARALGLICRKDSPLSMDEGVTLSLITQMVAWSLDDEEVFSLAVYENVWACQAWSIGFDNELAAKLAELLDAHHRARVGSTQPSLARCAAVLMDGYLALKDGMGTGALGPLSGALKALKAVMGLVPTDVTFSGERAADEDGGVVVGLGLDDEDDVDDEDMVVVGLGLDDE